MLRADQSQYSSLKHLLESLYGKDEYIKFKERTVFTDWKRECLKVLKTIEIAVYENVKIADDDWFDELNKLLEYGRNIIKSAKSPDGLFAALSSVSVRLNFLQLGMIPRAYLVKRVINKAANFNLSNYRSVQYVQSAQQKFQKKLADFRKTISDSQFLDLHYEYRRVKTELDFVDWAKRKLGI